MSNNHDAQQTKLTWENIRLGLRVRCVYRSSNIVVGIHARYMQEGNIASISKTSRCYSVKFDDGVELDWSYPDSFEIVGEATQAAPTATEGACRQCNKMNDIGSKNCWWCCCPNPV